MELADDDPFGPVNDECPSLRHEGDLPEVDVLFLDCLDIFYLRIRIDVEDDEPYGDLHGGGKSESPHDTLLFGVFRVADFVLNKLQRGCLV